MVVIPSAVFIELLVSIYLVKYHFSGRMNLRHDRSWKYYPLQTVHVLALWNIMITIQIITMIILPICVLLLIHPQQTVLYIIFLLMVPASLIVIVAYLLHQCQQPRRRKVCCNVKHCGRKCLELVVMIAMLGLIMTLLALYEVMLSVQLQIGTGVKGLIPSLLQSFPLSALGWYLKRSQRKNEKADDNEIMQLVEEEQLPEDIEPLPV